jgi:hypothetical protein
MKKKDINDDLFIYAASESVSPQFETLNIIHQDLG